MGVESVTEFDVVAGDGTSVRAWEHRDDTAEPSTVLWCPGLGATPEAWPDLLESGAVSHVVSWYHRGTFGSARPAVPSRITLAEHVDDALAVLDRAGVARCTVVGWSVGVGVAAELARRRPDRVSGLLLIAGTPGAGFEAMFGTLGVPAPLRPLLASTGAMSLRLLGPALDSVLHRMPATELSARLLQHSGFMRPGADPERVTAAMRRFLRHDWGWYFTLALATGLAAAVPLNAVRCPITLVVGRHDLLSDTPRAVASVAGLAQARVRIFDTSHFVPLEAPAELRDELTLLLRREFAVDCARLGLVPEDLPALETD
ncbi:alpha/beta fold hydrolase [Allosaccharopolyspora coralli]|uniref:Alpha/beta fold hydrolase n=1 Tax=Allosaccharopolyspora coralli TaxID=2665642 RepID=A0A5Q3QJV0_9PSEU|nr:alpha/beta hydrolase [Allosaccharopolyspora coralli]QGK71107.1 alpha/beta fold hydrolase [Allosaccharopolyspora coralli]